jgi:hypothetical protein
MSRSPFASRICALAVGLGALILLSRPGMGQDLDPNSWIPNGDVNAVAAYSNTIYMGGNFTEVGPPVGATASFDPSTGVLDPDFPTVVGQVYAIISDGAGGVYLGGNFTSVGGEPRTNLAHVNSANVVTSWDPVPNNYVLTLYRNPTTGTIYMGGLFTTIDGVARNRFGEVDANGNVTSYAPSISSTVTCIEMYNGFVIVGGQFANAGGQPRSRIASLHPTTGLADSWNPNANGTVNALKVVTHFVFGQGNVTSLIVGGSFTTIGGQARNGAANISLTTGLANGWNPNVGGTVYAIADYPNDFVLGGSFTSVGGAPCTNICFVNDQNGSYGVTAWAPFLDGPVFALLPHGSGEVIAAGRFTTAGGQPRRGIAALQLVNPGPATAWNPKPNGDVLALFDRGTDIVAGGEFTAANLVARNYLAAFDRTTGALLPWNPSPNAAVHAIALRKSFTLESVFVGGAFSQVNGVQRLRLVELDPVSGANRNFNPGAGSDPVYALRLEGNLLYVGGAFTGIGGVYRPGLAAVDIMSGQTQVAFAPMIFGGPVLAIELGPGVVYAGGSFTSCSDANVPRPGLAQFQASNGALTAWNPVPNGPTRALSMSPSGTSLVLGGDFTTINGTGRLRLASLGTTIPAALQSWNPSADGAVRCLTRLGNVIYAGGDFVSVNFTTTRTRLAGLDDASGLATPFNAGFAFGNVFAVAVDGPEYLVGGSFTTVTGGVQSRVARFTYGSASTCFFDPLFSSSASPIPVELAAGEFDGDGIADVIVCDPIAPPRVSILRGLGTAGAGNGKFTFANLFTTGDTARAAIAADFDADGRQDLATVVSGSSAPIGWVSIYRNAGGGSFDFLTQVLLLGHAEGIAAGDLDQDGILDLVVCLADSAGTAKGGIQFLRGGGTNGTWDGSFATGWKLPTGSPSKARRVALQDLNGDGTLDVVYSGKAFGQLCLIRMLPGAVPGEHEGDEGLVLPSPPGSGFVLGDLNGDGRTDRVGRNGRVIYGELRNSNDSATDPSPWFTGDPFAYLVLPSTPRELALLDYDFDGHLDLACTLDSLGLVVIHRGLGDGSFEADPFGTAALEASGLLVGDFAANGSPDLLVSQPQCGTVRVLPQSATSPLPLGLTLVTPNGGEAWATVPPSPGTEAPGSGPGTEVVTTAQSITWTKGAGVYSVDVELSRNGGITWQTIARNQPGTSLPWIVTPPGTGVAKVRVRDAAVASRADASDANFTISSGLVAVDPLPGLPKVAAIRMLGANPVRGPVAFRLDVPHRADVRVDVYDAAGRHVRTVARGRFEPGTHDLAWDARPSAGGRAAGPGAGVYFARALVGDVKTVSKFVVLR